MEAAELKAIQRKLIEWIETLDGAPRDKLSDLCSQMGLVRLERERLGSSRHSERIDAAYHLGIMRAGDCAEELIAMLEGEGRESTAFVVGRAAAKCATEPQQLRRIAEQIVKTHPHSHRLIADIVASSSMDPAPMYSELLTSREDALVVTALVGLSGCKSQGPLAVLDKLSSAADKEVRIKAVKLLLQSPAFPAQRIRAFLRHPDWEIRAAAAKAAGEQRLLICLDDLQHALSDDSWWVRRHSAHSLVRLGMAGFHALCETACAAEDSPCRESALEAVKAELEHAALAAAQDMKQQLYYNELTFQYQKTFNDRYASHPAYAPRISS
ncbi:HEAT repeat protein [Paenibacillus konkukensis]|uniref:HEAT repeat protein n=1 Tax=Paenibacillus konkukensis TaxID=2020716 RepID=A0ABY4RT84_9BACL|nr:HEAT repeat domain-containing protein [Paenibacillus konkukensis]UQZ85195.1 HEAT repeat protein [Paenibacillus konkukensis]